MELNLHSIATKSFVSGREFAEHDRVVSYLVRPFVPASAPRDPDAKPAFARYDLRESEDQPAFGKGDFSIRGTDSSSSGEASSLALDFVYCRWVVDYKARKEGNSDLALKLTAENLFLTIATPAGTLTNEEAAAQLQSSVNTPLLQFLALMMERKKIIKLRGYTEDGQRQLYEHMASHQMYEVPVGDLNVEFFQKIQEHLGVLVGTPKAKVGSTASAAPTQPVPAPVTN